MSLFYAMDAKRASKTAEGMALVRAIESQKPKGQRICDDSIARSLVSGITFVLSKLIIDSGLYGRFSHGTLEFITARERFIDDFLKACLAEGLDQVVILGAGFDTRAYRIPGIERTRVFEVDHPATQAVKLGRLRKAIGPLPDHITFIPMDFNTQSLGDRLAAGGYDEHARSLFIWQGVTMYLTATAVDSTLTYIATQAGPGSAVVFDYFYNETLRDMRRADVGLARRITRMIGEPLLFGIDRGQIEAFLGQRGFRDIQDTRADDLTRLYFTGLNAGRSVSTGVAIASAHVREPA